MTNLNTQPAIETNNETQPAILPASADMLFNSYDPKQPVTMEGLRTSKLLYKVNPNTKKALAENSCVFLPAIAAAELEKNLSGLSDYLCNYLETVQDKIIRELHLTGVASVKPEQVSIASIISYLESTTTTSRLSGDDIKAWFDADMKEGLLFAFVESMGLDADNISEEDLQRVEIVVGAYRGKFAMLASGKTVFKVEDIEQLTKALNVCGLADSPLGSRFIARMSNMTAKSEDVLMSL